MNQPAPHPDRLSELVAIIRRLRSGTGCPWDRKQTGPSLRKYLLEEARELAEAIDQEDPDHIREETGDLFFILVMLCEIYRDQNSFTLEDALAGICEKMIRRHPHVFGDMSVDSEEEQRRLWQAIKTEEKKAA